MVAHVLVRHAVDFVCGHARADGLARLLERVSGDAGGFAHLLDGLWILDPGLADVFLDVGLPRVFRPLDVGGHGADRGWLTWGKCCSGHSARWYSPGSGTVP